MNSLDVIMLRAVIFDLDGTLINLAFDYKKAKAEVISFLINSKVDEKVLDENKSIYLNIEAAINYIKKEFGEEYAKIIKEKAFDIVDKYEKEEIRKASLCENALNLINYIKSKGMKIAICTNNSSYTTFSILNKINIANLIDVVVTRDDVEKLKPYPDPLILACKKLNINPNEALYIGDSIVDLLTAKAVGMKFILLSKNDLKIAESYEEFNFKKVSSLKEIKEIIKVSV
ncbi:MAG: HAD family hydrolase [Nitrososphaerota archaeon]